MVFYTRCLSNSLLFRVFSSFMKYFKVYLKFVLTSVLFRTETSLFMHFFCATSPFLPICLFNLTQFHLFFCNFDIWPHSKRAQSAANQKDWAGACVLYEFLMLCTCLVFIFYPIGGGGLEIFPFYLLPTPLTIMTENLHKLCHK